MRPVQLTVRDSRGSTTVASLTLVLDESSDLDNDGILNRDDLCPAVFGLRDNSGCPVVEVYSGPRPNSTASGTLIS